MLTTQIKYDIIYKRGDIRLNDINKRIAEVFYFLKKEKKITQKSFGEKANLSRDIVINILYDRVPPNERHIKALCNAHHIRYAWVMTGEGEMFEELDEEQEFAFALGEMLFDERPNIKRTLMKVFMECNEEEVAALYEFCKKRVAEQEKSEGENENG